MKKNIKKVYPLCPLCQSNDYTPVVDVREHEYVTSTDDTFTVVQCNECSFYYLNPRPDKTELSTIYPQDYYSYSLADEYANAAKKKTLMFRLRDNYYRHKLNKLINYRKQHSENAGPLRVLDVGCGDGRLLDVVKDICGGQVQTFGVEYNPQAVEMAAARGHRMYCGDLAEVDIEGQFDIILSTDLIEHVESPVDHVQQLSELVLPGGILQIQTPNIDSWDWKLFKKHWGGYHTPRHWSFFTKQTLSQLLEKNGFNILEVEFFPSATFWNWTFHNIITTLGMRALADKVFPPVKIFHNSFQSFLILSFFSVVDMAMLRLTGRTSNMNIYSLNTKEK